MFSWFYPFKKEYELMGTKVFSLSPEIGEALPEYLNNTQTRLLFWEKD